MSFSDIGSFKPKEHELFPEGNYRAWVTRINDSQLDTEYGFVALTFLIIQEGPYKEKTIEQLLNLKGKTQSARDYAEDMLTGLMRSLGFNNGVSSWDDLLHKPVEIVIKTNHWNGQAKSQVSGYNPDPFGDPSMQNRPPRGVQQPPQQFRQPPMQHQVPQQQYQQPPMNQVPQQQFQQPVQQQVPQQQYQQPVQQQVPQQQYQQPPMNQVPQQQVQQPVQQQSQEDFDDDIPF